MDTHTDLRIWLNLNFYIGPQYHLPELPCINTLRCPSELNRAGGAGGTGRIDWIYCFLRFRLPAIASRSGEADGDETEKWQSRFQRERKAKEADCIITERSCRFFIVFLLPKS